MRTPVRSRARAFTVVLAVILASGSARSLAQKPTPAKGGGGAPTKIKINVADCENKLWVDMPGGMSPLVELEGPATLPECASVALGATRQALTASSGLAAAAKGLSISVDFAGKAVGGGLVGDAVVKVLQSALESGGSLDGFTDKLGDAALEKGAGSLGGALGFGANGANGKLTPDQDDALKKIAENVWKALKSEETVQTHRDSFHFGSCDGEFVVTVTANFGEAHGEVRIAASGDCHCTEMRGGVRVGKFTVVGFAPLTFSDLHKGGKNEWTMSCTMGGPQYFVWAPCCMARDGSWTTPGPEPPSSTPGVTLSPEDPRRAADRRGIEQRCDPDGEKGAAVARARSGYDILRADNAGDAALEAARAKLADAQKPLCDCLGNLRSDPALAGDAGLLGLLDDMLALYCAPPVRYVRPLTPVPHTAVHPCAAFRDAYEGARQRSIDDANDPGKERAMVSAHKALCACLKEQNGGKLPPEAEAFCDPKTLRKPVSPPPLTSAPPGPAQETPIGFVVPTRTYRNERSSGTLVTDPKTYEKVPDVVVLPLTVPLRRGADGKPTLEGTHVRIGNGPSRPATGPIPIDPEGGTRVVVIPPGGTPVTAGEIPIASGEPPRTPPGTTGPPTCTPGGTVTLRGPFGGDGRVTRVTVGGHAVPVLSETPRQAVVPVPSDVPAGPVEIVVREGLRARRLVVPAIRLRMTADRLKLLRGESTSFHVVVDGLGSISSASWAGGPDPEALDRTALDRTAPGFRVPASGGPGVLVLTIENGSRDTITMLKSVGEAIVLTIDHASVPASGSYAYDGTLQSLKDGTFRVTGTVVPLLAPPQAEDVP